LNNFLLSYSFIILCILLHTNINLNIKVSCTYTLYSITINLIKLDYIHQNFNFNSSIIYLWTTQCSPLLSYYYRLFFVLRFMGQILRFPQYIAYFEPSLLPEHTYILSDVSMHISLSYYCTYLIYYLCHNIAIIYNINCNMIIHIIYLLFVWAHVHMTILAMMDVMSPSWSERGL
jgi:hypothetical protein